MRIAAATSLGLAVLLFCGQATPPSVRRLSDVDLGVFFCAPNRTHRLMTSEADLANALAALEPNCPAGVFEQRRQALLRGLTRARLNWSEEALVIAQDWYGTGMAKPSLVVSGPSNGALIATILWKVPPPPVTPDTASCTFAFAVKRSAVRRISVTGQNSGSSTFLLSR